MPQSQLSTVLPQTQASFDSRFALVHTCVQSFRDPRYSLEVSETRSGLQIRENAAERCFTLIGSSNSLSTRSKRKITCQLELETVRRTLQTSASALVVDDKEIAVGAVDVT